MRGSLRAVLGRSWRLQRAILALGLILIVALALVAIDNAMPAPTFAATPVITKVATLYNSGRTGTVTQMTPQIEYAVKVTVADEGKIDDLSTVVVTIAYDSDADNDYSDMGAANTQTCFIMTCTVGGTNGTWSHEPSLSTTWDVVDANCKQPTLTDDNGTFWFHFKPGKVATEAGDWDIYVVATDDGELTDTWYDGSDYDMLWYGEINVSGTGLDWGSVPPGIDFIDESAKETLSASYISNGDYDAAVTTAATWGSGSALNTAGTPGANEFSLKAWSSDNLTAADLVTTTAADCIIDNTGDLTTESGDPNDSITLYLKLGTAFMHGSYSGAVTLYVRNG